MARTFSDWYEENKKSLLQKRKEKYRTDEEYRLKQKERSANYRSRQEKKKKENRRSWSLARVIVCKGGRIELVWSFPVLAERLGISVKTCDGWQRRGLFPNSPIRVGKARFYTEYMVRSAIGIYGDGPSLEKCEKLRALWYASFRSLGWKGVCKYIDAVSLQVAPGCVVHGIDVFANRANKTTMTAWKWLDDKWLPEPPMLAGRPVFTDDMILSVVNSMKQDRVKIEMFQNEELIKTWEREKNLLKGFTGDKNV